MKCVICGYEILGFGNNALPVRVGQCCGACNDTVVIPKRINNLFKYNLSKKEEKVNETV